jgi:hypothetical protein
MRRLLGLCVLLCLASSAEARELQWIATWGAAPLPPSPAMGPLPATPSFSNQTIRQVVRIAAGGERRRRRACRARGCGR